MANFYSTQYALQDPTRANPSRLLASNLASGTLQIANIDYVTTSGTDEATNDIIYLCKLPLGTIVIPALCSAATIVDIGTAFVFDVGYAANTDAYADGIIVSAVGSVGFQSATFPSGGMANEPMTTEDLIATVITSTAPVAGVAVHFVIAYLVPRG